MSREKENFLFHFHLHTFVTHIAEKVKMKLQKQFLQNNYKRKGFQLSFLRENNPLIKAESIFISDFSLKIYWGSVFMCRTRKCVKHDSIKIFLLFSTREKPEKNLNRKTWNIINLGRSENHFFFHKNTQKTYERAGLSVAIMSALLSESGTKHLGWMETSNINKVQLCESRVWRQTSTHPINIIFGVFFAFFL